MSLRSKLGFAQLTPEERAAKIKAKHAAKRTSQGLFTPAQEELMEELGLRGNRPIVRDEVPGEESERAAKPKKVRDPLTKRQRRLMEELGLTSHIPDRKEESD